MGLHWDVTELPLARGYDRPDFLITIRHPLGKLDLTGEIKLRPTTQLVNRLGVQPGGQPAPVLLIADYINPKLAEELRKRDVFFIDAAGNAYIRDTGLYIWVAGKRDLHRLRAQRERTRAFQPSGLKLLFALLCRPELAEAGFRTLGETADVALGTVQWVIRDLVAAGYILRLDRFKRRLVEPWALLDAWTPAYVRDLRPRLLIDRFEAPAINWWRHMDLRHYDALWGGEPAAAQYTRFLKPATLTIYAEKIPARLVVKQELEKAPDGRVDFRKKFWRFDNVQNPTAAPPILVYADLMALGDTRARDAADRIRKEYIDGPFERHQARWPR